MPSWWQLKYLVVITLEEVHVEKYCSPCKGRQKGVSFSGDAANK